MNLVVELSNVHHTKRIPVFRDTNFTSSWSDGRKRFPIIGLLSVLHLIELVPSVAPCVVRERPQIVERGIYEIDLLRSVASVTHRDDI